MIGGRRALDLQSRTAHRLRPKFALAALAVVALVGLGRLWDPFAGDQALFLLGGSALHGGAFLYRDFWDLKQPGIYEFYRIAGAAFGFTPLAVHLFELGWWLVLSGAEMLALGPCLRRPALAALAPLATAATFYLGATIHDFGQPEALAGMPLFASVWLFVASFERRRGAIWFAGAAGLFAGLAVLGKLLFAAIAVAAMFAAWLTLAPGLRRGLWRIAVVACAAAVPLGTYAAAAAVHHALAAALYTWFVVPQRILATLPHAPPARLAGDAKSYALTYALPLALAAAGAFSRPAPRARVWRAAMLAWLAAAAAVIVVQRFSWWEYHFTLFAVPVGVLATLGCDALLARSLDMRGGRRLVAGVLFTGLAVLLTAPSIAAAARRVAALVATRAPFSSAGAERYRRAQSVEYRDSSRIAGFLAGQPRAPAGIFVAGDPLVLLLSGTVSRVAINGWGLELLLPVQWRTLAAELSAARPADVFVEADYETLVAQRSPAITAWLRREYRVAERSTLGTWFARR